MAVARERNRKWRDGREKEKSRWKREHEGEKVDEDATQGEGIFARDSALEVTPTYPFTSSIFVFRSSERFTFPERIGDPTLVTFVFRHFPDPSKVVLRSWIVARGMYRIWSFEHRSGIPQNDFWGIWVVFRVIYRIMLVHSGRCFFVQLSFEFFSV